MNIVPETSGSSSRSANQFASSPLRAGPPVCSCCFGPERMPGLPIPACRMMGRQAASLGHTESTACFINESAFYRFTG
jgi:hypothetical protein